MSRECEAPGCEKERYYAKKYCRNHHLYLTNHGRLEKPTAAERFWDKVHKGESCWQWQGKPMKVGYGCIGVSGKNIYAHRFSFELNKGEIPDGYYVDHICRNKLCVNPDHLRLVTNKQNQEHRSRTRPGLDTPYRGVSRHLKSDLWKARVKHGGVEHNLGYFKDPNEAAEVARKKRIELFTHNLLDFEEE